MTLLAIDLAVPVLMVKLKERGLIITPAFTIHRTVLLCIIRCWLLCHRAPPLVRCALSSAMHFFGVE
jgi:hypothetical protein